MHMIESRVIFVKFFCKATCVHVNQSFVVGKSFLSSFRSPHAFRLTFSSLVVSRLAHIFFALVLTPSFTLPSSCSPLPVFVTEAQCELNF